MQVQGNLVWALIAILAVVLLSALVLFFSRNVRLRRRLRRTRDPIVSKARQPSVKFSVKPPPE